MHIVSWYLSGPKLYLDVWSIQTARSGDGEGGSSFLHSHSWVLNLTQNGEKPNFYRAIHGSWHGVQGEGGGGGSSFPQGHSWVLNLTLHGVGGGGGLISIGSFIGLELDTEWGRGEVRKLISLESVLGLELGMEWNRERERGRWDRLMDRDR